MPSQGVPGTAEFKVVFQAPTKYYGTGEAADGKFAKGYCSYKGCTNKYTSTTDFRCDEHITAAALKTNRVLPVDHPPLITMPCPICGGYHETSECP